MPKKQNREGNKYNLGRLKGATGFVMNLSKGQAHTTAKKHKNKSKLANTNWCNRPILQPKQASTNPSKKNINKSWNNSKSKSNTQ